MRYSKITQEAGKAYISQLELGYVKFALPDVGPAPDLTIQATPARIEHGRYLAKHVAVCIDCHSTRDYSRLTAPIVAGTEGKGGEGFTRELGFPGNFYAPNITPAALGNWTDGEIFRAVTTGVSRDGHALFPVMPYKNYGQMDPEDIKDIIAYLRTLKPIRTTVPPSEPDFPVNFIINTLPARSNGGKRPDTTDQVAYGRYLITFAACAECHTPRNEQGDPLPGMDYAGGNVFPLPSGTVYSANITPAKTGIGAWTRQMFIARFKAHENADALPKLHEGETNSVMPWPMFARMNESDLGAIYAYLRTIKPVENQIQKFTPKAKLVANR